VTTPQWWQWPTVLSMDAPLVCVAWYALLARVVGTRAAWPQAVVIGASVWLAYAADRWIEAWRLAPGDIRTERHHFYLRHRWPVALVWVCVFALDVAVAVVALSARHLIAGGVLAVLVLLYLLSHQLVHRHRRWRVPKEVCIAILLTAGVCIFLPAAANPAALTTSATLFALLCFSNCALISHWEREVDLIHQQSSLATRAGAAPWVIQAVPWGAAFIALICLMSSVGPLRTVAICALASAVLLGVVDRLEPHTGRRVARVLSDVALLTPLASLVFLI